MSQLALSKTETHDDFDAALAWVVQTVERHGIEQPSAMINAVWESDFDTEVTVTRFAATVSWMLMDDAETQIIPDQAR